MVSNDAEIYKVKINFYKKMYCILISKENALMIRR
jgi:hypothetical protein